MGEDRGASAFVKGYNGKGGSPLDLCSRSVCMSEGDRGSTVVKALCYSRTAVAQWLRRCATVGPW